MKCLCSYLSRVKCRLFACGPADATAISSSLASLKLRIVYLLAPSYAGCLGKMAAKQVYMFSSLVYLIVLCILLHSAAFVAICLSYFALIKCILVCGCCCFHSSIVAVRNSYSFCHASLFLGDCERCEWHR